MQSEGRSGFSRDAVVEAERCQSGRSGTTRNRLTWETRSVGSNPTLSASLLGIKIPQGRYGIRRRNDILAVADMDQPFVINIPLLRMNQDASREWFAIRTKPQQEQVAKLHYQRQGYQVYLPMMRTIVRHARRTEEKLRPFFSGYLFLHLALAERNWVAISSTRGALGPICFGDHYVSVPDWIIADLQAKEDGSGAVPLADLQKKRLTPGVAVAVQLDDDTSAQGLFYSFSGQGNVVVLLSFLNRQLRTTLPLEKVQPQ